MEETTNDTGDCTSPSILQDITMDKSEMDSRIGATTGLTMKEYDEQLKKLTAENFQLKLKIYFMDNRISKMEGVQDKDLIKENVELRITNEEQSKELEEKLKLIFEASEAFEQLQKHHSSEITALENQHSKEKQELEVKLGALEAGLRVMELRAESTPSPEDIDEFRNQIDILEERLKLEVQKAADLDFELKDRDGVISAMETKISTLLENLQDKESELTNLKEENSKALATIKSFVRRVQADRSERERLAEQLKEKQRLVDELSQCLESQNKTYSQRPSTEDNHSPRKAESAVSSLDEAMSRISEFDPEDVGDGDAQGNLAVELEAKKGEIQKLNRDLKKRTHYLQELVNKELWDKNRHIEKLEIRLEEASRTNSEELQRISSQLRSVTNEKVALSQEVETLREREEPLRQACCLLTIRLEELAGFLDSLLTDRALLGEKYDIIREAVERSRELSRSLNMSLDDYSGLTNRSTMTNQSLVISKLREHLSVLTEQVRQRDIELALCHADSAIRPDCTKDEDQSEYVLSIPLDLDEHFLNFSVDAPGADGDRRRSTKLTNKTPEKPCVKPTRTVDVSESEAWSEPDRNVSQARMGRIETSVTPLRLSKCGNSSDSSDDTLNDNRTPGKRTRSVDPESRKLQSKVRHLEEANKRLREQIVILENKHSILNKLGGESAPQLLLEIQRSLSELEETRDICKRLTSELATARGDLSIAKEDLAAKHVLCAAHQESITALQSKVDEVVFEYELRLLEISKQKEAAEQRSEDLEERIKEAEVLRKDLEDRVVEIDKKVAESRRFKTETSAQVREAAQYADTAEKLIQNAKRDRAESDRKILELQQLVDCLRSDVEEKSKNLDMLEQRAAREKGEALELKRRLREAEQSKVAVELKVKEAKDQIQWMEGKLRELEQAMDQCESETKARIAEEVRKGIDAKTAELRREWVPRVELEKTTKENQSIYENFKVREEELMKRINRIDCEKRDIWRQLDEVRVRGSEVELDLSKMANEKVQLEENLRRAVEKHNSLLHNHQQSEQKFLNTIRNLERQIEEEKRNCVATSNEILRHQTTSPDLGIDSDHGRFSSLDLQEQQPSLQNNNTTDAVRQLEEENEELKRRLLTLQQTLHHTMAELSEANRHKKQMERAVCKQLHKTHHILKKARINLEMQDSDSVEERQGN